jgi:hypothetical protein
MTLLLITILYLLPPMSVLEYVLAKGIIDIDTNDMLLLDDA